MVYEFMAGNMVPGLLSRVLLTEGRYKRGDDSKTEFPVCVKLFAAIDSKQFYVCPDSSYTERSFDGSELAAN